MAYRNDTQEWLDAMLAAHGENPRIRKLLLIAADTLDAYHEARHTLTEDGRWYRDRFDQPKKHPMCEVEAGCRKDFLAYMREFREVLFDEVIDPDEERFL